MTPRETDPDLPASVQQSLAEVWVGGGCCEVGGTDLTVRARDLLKEVTILFITSTIVWPTNREGTQPHPSTENWIKDLLSMALHFRERLRFPHSQSLASGNFHKPLILQRAERMKITITEN